MKNLMTILVLLLFCAGAYSPNDGFSNIRCGSDIPKALIGRYMANERVAVIENRHKDLGLKNLGAIEISDKLFGISWKICGNEVGRATLSAKAAWKIDGKGKSFIKISTEGLLCSRDGIITEDGGR